MSFLSATDLSAIDAAIQLGRGAEAGVLGQTFDVFRLSATTNPSGITGPGSLIASNVPAIFQRNTSNLELETELPGKVLFFSATLNMLPFVEGDVFVQREDSYRYERSIYTLCSNRPSPRQPIFAFTPINATISRPMSNPNFIDSGRAPQSVPIKGINEKSLCLYQGDYEFEFVGATIGFGSSAIQATPATIPIGMVMDRLREYPKSDDALATLYDDTRRQTWSMFLPEMPGASIMPRDIVTGANGDRFEVTGVMPEYSNFVGQLITTQRLRN